MIRHRATGRSDRLGSIFFNPGGPGGSGVAVLPALYRHFPAVLRRHFDLVSFDPRGVGQSTAVRCFASARADARFFAAIPEGFPMGRAQTRRWVRDWAELGRRCERRVGYLLPHLSTADVARDMDLLRQAVGDPMMNYLGTSYGTYLGATYANLFPDKVRAMVLDAVVDPLAWAKPGRSKGVSLGTFLRVGMDVGQRATMNQYLRLCARAGVRRCGFAAGTARATRAKYATLLRRLRRGAVDVRLSGRMYQMTFGGIVSFTAASLYTVDRVSPGSGWVHLARVLEAVWRATGRRGRHALVAAPALPGPVLPGAVLPGAVLPGAGLTTPVPGSAAASYPALEQGPAILCADSPNPRNVASYPRQARLAYARSGAFGYYVTWITEGCATWPARDADGYYGPWNRPTASPILLVGGTYDPATPYHGAVALARLLARARLLTADGYGHAALVNRSDCVNRYESAYFLTGALPRPGTVCQQSIRPFGLPPAG